MQRLVGSGTPVLYIGRTVLKGKFYICITTTKPDNFSKIIYCLWDSCHYTPVTFLFSKNPQSSSGKFQANRPIKDM